MQIADCMHLPQNTQQTQVSWLGRRPSLLRIFYLEIYENSSSEKKSGIRIHMHPKEDAEIDIKMLLSKCNLLI